MKRVILCLNFVCDEFTANVWLQMYAKSLGVKEAWAKPKQGNLRLVLGQFNLNEIQRMEEILKDNPVTLEIE